MRWPLATAVLIASGCTCLFDPSRVKLPCEPPVPPPLDAIAGDGTSLTFEWPLDTSRDDITEWELCWGASACRKVPARACDAGCRVVVDGTDAGFQYNVRVQARVTMKNLCGDVSAPSTVSTTPLNGSFRDVQGIELIPGCDAGIKIVNPGELTFDQQGFLCVSTAMMGDDQWRDGTLDLEVRVPIGEGAAGFGVRAARDGGTAAARNGIIVTAGTGAQASALITRRAVLGVDTGSDVAVASSVPLVRGNDWEAMRVSMAGEWLSVSLGDDATTLREVMRWRDRTSPTPTGRLGVALATTLGGGRVDVRNLRVRSSVTIPDGGATSDSWSFSSPDPLRGIRPVGSATTGTCPAYPAAPGCSGCTPVGNCLQLMGGGSATVEVPIGLDYNRPWRVKFKLGVGPVAANASVLRTTVVGPNPNAFNGFGGFAIIDAPGVNWNQELRAFESPGDALGMLTPMTWNAFEVIFNPGNNGYTINRNGMLQRAGTQPANWAQHRGALVLGGGNLNAQFAELEISQDP